MDDPGGRERTRAIVEAALHQLRGPIRRTRRRQRLRRWRGRAFFHLEHVTGQPAHVHLAGTGFTPLWETRELGPNDLDLLTPSLVARRVTLGQTWLVNDGYDGFHATIKLVVDRDGQAVLLTHDRGRYPADRYGWIRLVNDLGPEFSGERG